MIKKLTKEQESQLSVYRDKWLAIGLSTARINREEAKKDFWLFNKLVLGKKGQPIVVFMDSPLTAWLATCLLYQFIAKCEMSQVWSQVESQVRSQVWSQVELFVYPYFDGNLMSSYFSFYDYCNKVLKIKFKEQKKWDCYLQTSNVQLIYPFKEFVVMSEKPIDIKMKNNILHNENGPSIKYADGFSVWSLNGIKVPQWLVETRAEEIDCNEFAKIENEE